MKQVGSNLPVKEIYVDAALVKGSFEWWRHSYGQGGVNPFPIEGRVLDGIQKLKPRMIRVFIQEYFNIYPDHNTYNWDLLDPFLESFVKTGAKLVCSISLKPKLLYPVVDHAIWKPTNKEEWYRLIYELTKRYSVEKKYVTHWEIANEPDIGERGATPFFFSTPQEYGEFYRMTIEPILAACPDAKVGGPVVACSWNDFLPGFVEHCYRTNTRLDFVSWHLYSDNPLGHAREAQRVADILDRYPGQRPEMMCTEWNRSLEQPYAIPELWYQPRRAAVVGAVVAAFMNSRIDYSFLYHIREQVLFPEMFRKIVSEEILKNQVHPFCNEFLMDLGMFGTEGDVLPRYFVYQMISRMGNERVEITSEDPDIYALAAKTGNSISTYYVNYNRVQSSEDKVVTVKFRNTTPGPKVLKVFRIDENCRWSQEDLELIPVEVRHVYALEQFNCQAYCPADSVTMIVLQDI